MLRARLAWAGGPAACRLRAPATGPVEGLVPAPGGQGTPQPSPVVPAAGARVPLEPQAVTAGAEGAATALAGVGPGAPAPPGGGGRGGSDFVNPQFLSPGVPVVHADGVNLAVHGRIVVVYHAPPVFCGATIYADTTLHHDLDCRGKPGITIGGLLDPGVEGARPARDFQPCGVHHRRR